MQLHRSNSNRSSVAVMLEVATGWCYCFKPELLRSLLVSEVFGYSSEVKEPIKGFLFFRRIWMQKFGGEKSLQLSPEPDSTDSLWGNTHRNCFWISWFHFLNSQLQEVFTSKFYTHQTSPGVCWTERFKGFICFCWRERSVFNNELMSWDRKGRGFSKYVSKTTQTPLTQPRHRYAEVCSVSKHGFCPDDSKVSSTASQTE